jgi:hypothetical protein
MNYFSKVQQYYTYHDFLQLMQQLVDESSTSGTDQSEFLVGFTKLNFQRMQRLDKTAQLTDTLSAKMKHISPQIWWIITEAWCGDSAQNLPFIAKAAEASGGRVELRIILRDEHTDIMNNYLTNGGKSIPKLIALDGDKELFRWGPRPQLAQGMMVDWKRDPRGKTFEEFENELHTWYTKDKGVSTQTELLDLIK